MTACGIVANIRIPGPGKSILPQRPNPRRCIKESGSGIVKCTDQNGRVMHVLCEKYNKVSHKRPTLQSQGEVIGAIPCLYYIVN